MIDLINKTKDYIKDVLGRDVVLTAIDSSRTKALPLIIKGKYAFYDANLLERDIVFMFTKGDANIAAQELRKHVDLAFKAFNKQIVFGIGTLESYNRKRLINKKIAFIVPGKQMYIPGMLVDLQDFGTKPQKKPNSMTPAAQYLLLYHLQVENLEGIQMQSIAKKLGYGSMTITRAANYLQEEGICQVKGKKEKSLVFNNSKQELWKEVNAQMESPVKRTIFLSNGIDLSNHKRTNINALSKYTAIADDRKKYFALTDKEFKALKETEKILEYNQHDGDVAIEIWKYNPEGLCKGKYVDPLSLYLIFRENEDERIQIVLDEMMEEIKW